MYKTKHLGLNITEMPKDANTAFNFKQDLGDNFEAIDEETLTHRNITNCILEVPQDIKVEITDGVITVKKGSKIWAAYGTEDLTTNYPIGSAFLHENFMVHDTQYTDGKFFVRVELQADTQHEIQGNAFESALVLINLSTNIGTDFGIKGFASGTTILTNGFLYNTSTNYVNKYVNSEKDDFAYTLPIMLITKENGAPVSIDHVFNGFGYIGSTIFALPGVKCLIPNGKHEDGSLKNVAHTLNSIQSYNITEEFVDENAPIVLMPTHIGYFKSNRTLYYGEKPINPYHHTRWYDSKNNYWYEYSNENGWQIEFYCVIGGIDIDNTKINSFTPRKPFHAVDYNDYQTKITELEAKIETLQTAIEALQG